MPQGTATIERSGRRILVYLAGSAAILLGTWLAFRGVQPAPETPQAEPALAHVGGVQPAAIDPIRSRAESDPADDRLAMRIPAIEPVSDGELSPERAAWRADPGPVIQPDLAAISALQAAREAATAQLQNLLDDRHDALRRACGKKGGHAATVFVQATFGADGELLAHDVGDNGTTPEVRECVRAQPFAMKIPPPGVEFSVRATLAFP